jgi:putative heme-binding domain-containing protein
LESRDAAVRERASKIFASASAQRGKVVAEYVQALVDPGDREAGRKVYDRECASCHKLGGQGREVGPDLATVGGRTPQQLIANILDPNQEVLPAFTEYTVLLQDGRVATGLLAAESAGEIRLRRAEGIDQIVPRDEIDEIQNSGRSLMPEGLEQKITPREMSDLIAFLRNFDAP